MLNRDDLAGDQLRLVEALIGARLAWQTPTALARLSGMDLDAVHDALIDLDLAGWIVPWDQAPGGLAVTFTPLATEVLRIRIIEVGMAENPRWAGADTPEPPMPVAFSVFSSYGPMALFGLLVSRELEPADELDLAEAIDVAMANRLHLDSHRPPRRDRSAEVARDEGRPGASEGSPPEPLPSRPSLSP